MQTSPGQVRIRFTENIEPAVSSIQVFDASGKEVDKRDLHLDRSDHALLQRFSAAARRRNLQGRLARSFRRYTRDKRKLYVPGRSLGTRGGEQVLTSQLIIARAVHIGASILLAGILLSISLCLLRLVGLEPICTKLNGACFAWLVWSLFAALLFPLCLVLPRGREHEWIVA